MGYDYKSMGNEPWISGWWFGTWFLFFNSVGNNNPNWLSYFSEGLKPPPVYIYMYYCVLYYIHIDDVWWFMMIFWWIYIFDYPFVFNIMMIADLLALNTTKQTLSGRWWTRSVDIILVELTILCSFLWI
jgi:hypothetical protein